MPLLTAYAHRCGVSRRRGIRGSLVYVYNARLRNTNVLDDINQSIKKKGRGGGKRKECTFGRTIKKTPPSSMFGAAARGAARFRVEDAADHRPAQRRRFVHRHDGVARRGGRRWRWRRSAPCLQIHGQSSSVSPHRIGCVRLKQKTPRFPKTNKQPNKQTSVFRLLRQNSLGGGDSTFVIGASRAVVSRTSRV